MSNRSTYFLKLGVLLFLGMTMVGCSSTGRFMNDNMSTEQVMKELESYTPAWKPTGDSDMDRVGRSAVMSIEDKKPAMDAMFASLWAEYDLMEWTNAAKADLQEKGISWGEADAEQRDAAMAVAWTYLDDLQKEGIKEFYAAKARNIRATNDDAAETLTILNDSLRTAESIYGRVQSVANSPVDGAIALFSDAPKIGKGIDQLTEMVQWGNATSKYMSCFANANDTWDRIFQENDRKAMQD